MKVPRNCLICGVLFTPHPTARKGIYCSAFCRNGGNARTSAEHRGNLLRGTGTGIAPYIKRGGRHEHRVIAEQIIGRKLLPGEIVHHKNEDGHDNAPENLEVLPSQAEHARQHGFRK